MQEGRDASGLRLILTAGVPGPWGEAAKYVLAYKGMSYLAVRQEAGVDDPVLREWTGQTSAPVLVDDSAPPASHWFDLIMLAERLSPEKSVLPSSMADRALSLGLTALIAGADGFGWQRRLHMLAPLLRMEEPPAMATILGHKYGWSEAAVAAALAQLQAISETLDAQLAAQADKGSSYFVGTSPSVVDFYWASFAGMIKPLPEDVNPMPDYMRQTYEAKEPETLALVTPRLEAHRDAMYRDHIALPLDF